jgi:DNA helicase HerA-like ATPase
VLLERIELIVRLVRSKGVGVYFVTQNPLDIPDSVLAQLGNRIQHALRAFTPRDQKAVKATAETMRQNPKLDIETAITELAVGEALVSLLDEKGRPSVTERVFVIPPASQIGAINAEQRTALIASSIVAGVYEKTLDRESAYEKLTGRAAAQMPSEATADKASEGGSFLGSVVGGLGSIFGGGSKGGRMTPGEQMVKSAASAIGRELGRQVLRGVLGSIFKGR